MPVFTLPGRASGSSPSRVVPYVAVTLVNVFLGLATLVVLYGFLGWHGVPAAVTAVVASSVPCFWLNRQYVWRRGGRVRIRAEVMPFALFTLLGLVASTALVYVAARRYDNEVMVYVAHQSAFGMLWVMRFVFFERLWNRPVATVRSLSRRPRRTLRPAAASEDLAA